MFKNKHFATQLTIVHIVNFSVIILVLVIVNFVLLARSLNYNVDKSMLQKSHTVEHLLNMRMNEIEMMVDIIDDQHANHSNLSVFKINKLLKNPYLTNLQVYPEYNQATIGSQNYVNIGQKAWFYNRILKNGNKLVLTINENWINDLISPVDIPYPYLFALLKSNSEIVLSNNQPLITEKIYINTKHGKTDLSNLGIVSTSYLKHSFIGESEIEYKSIVTFVPRLNCYIAIFHPQNYIFEHLGRYVAIILMFVVILMIVMVSVIVRTNRKLTLTINDIMHTIRNSKFLNISEKSDEYDLIQIKRSIESLMNQLNFYIKKLDATIIKNQKIENDIEIAKRLQKSILPKLTEHKNKLNKHIDVAALYEAAYDIGGDLYDYFMLDKRNMLIAVGDISGKGIPAALFMIYTQTLLRSIAKSERSVSDIVNELNNRLSEENKSDMFVTMLVGIIDTETGKLSICNAAHNLPLIIRQEGNIEELPDTHGIPLGIYANKNYSQTDIQLNFDDQFLIYTDGIIDSKDENGMNYSVDVLKYNLMGSWFLKPNQVVEKVKASIVGFRGNIPPVDDLTLLVIKYLQQEE